MSEFTMTTTVEAAFGAALDRVRAALADAGFGVITEIDMAATFKTKLDVEIPPKVILGACRPQLAYTALQVDDRVAALLPCNVVVSAIDSATTRVEAMDPYVMDQISGGKRLNAVATEARERLAGMLKALGGAA